MSTRARWEDAFVATSMVLGETPDAIRDALGGLLPFEPDLAREARARVAATALATVLRELETLERGPWPK